MEAHGSTRRRPAPHEGCIGGPSSSNASSGRLPGWANKRSHGAQLTNTPHQFLACQVDIMQWKDRKSTRLNSSHLGISYAVFCLKKKKKQIKYKDNLKHDNHRSP